MNRPGCPECGRADMSCSSFSFLCQLAQLEQVAMGMAFDKGRLQAVASEALEYDKRAQPIATSALISRIRALEGLV